MAPDLVEVAPIYVRALRTPRDKLEKNSIAYGMAFGLDPNTKTVAYIGHTPFDVQKAEDGTVTISERPVSFLSPLVEPAGMPDGIFWHVYQEEKWWNFHYGPRAPVEGFEETDLRGRWAVGIQFHADNVVRVFLTTDGKDWAWNKAQVAVDPYGKPLYDGWQLSRELELFKTGESGRYVWTLDMDVIGGIPPQPFEGYYVLDKQTGAKLKAVPMTQLHKTAFPYLPGNDKIERRTWVYNVTDLEKNKTYGLMGVFNITNKSTNVPEYWAFGWPLSLKTGRLKVTTTQPGAKLLISGIDGEFSTPYDQEISPGTYTLTLQSAEYTDATIPISILPEKTATVHFDYADALATGKVTEKAPPETKFTIWDQKPLLDQIWDFFTDPEIAEYATPLIWEKAGLGAVWDAVDWISTTFGIAFPLTENAAAMMARGETPPEDEVRHIIIIGPMGTEKIVTGAAGKITTEEAGELVARLGAKTVEELYDASITKPILFRDWVAGFKPGEAEAVYRWALGHDLQQRIVFAVQEAAKSRIAAALAKQPWYAALDPTTKAGMTKMFGLVVAGLSLGTVMPWAIKEGMVEAIIFPMWAAIESGDYEVAKNALDQAKAQLATAQSSAQGFAWLNPLTKSTWDNIIENWSSQLDIFEDVIATMKPLPPGEVETGLYFSGVPAGAIVTVDGKEVDYTQLVTVTPDVGHLVKVTKTGYEDFEETHTVREGYPLTVKVFMPELPRPPGEEAPDPEKSYIRISDVPSGAVVYLDGLEVDTSVIQEVEAGVAHTVRATLEGYEDFEETSIVPKGTVKTVYLFMRAIPVPPEPKPTEALLIITSVPDEAQVWIGGEDTGELTPFEKLLGKGTYTITLKKDGYRDRTVTTTIYPPTENTLGLALTELEVPETQGSIEVITDPAGADVYLNGLLYKYKSNTVLDMLEPGTHTVEVEKAGYERAMLEVAVEAGAQAPANFKLTVIPGERRWKVSVGSDPQAARILVDGVYSGRTTPGYIILGPGQYTIGVTLYGYEPAQETITLGEG